MPDPQTAREFLEIFENHYISGVIFTQTTVHSVRNKSGNVVGVSFCTFLASMYKYNKSN